MKAAVIGDPVAHSKSPLIHGYWIERLGLAASYTRVHVRADALAEFVATLRADGWRGVNVTLPHKVAIAALCDDLTPLARRVGAVNTVIVGEGGTLLGHNTDVAGFTTPLRARTWSGARACVLGAGGAARAITTGLADLGFAAIHVVNRTPANIAALPVACIAHDWNSVEAALAGADLLVNTTALGMTGKPPLDIDLAPLAPDAWVNDIVYAPLETGLLAQARARGLHTVDGMEMLIGQAAEAFSLFFGQAPPRDPASDAGLRAVLA